MFGKLRLPTCATTEALRDDYRAHFCASCHAMRETSVRALSLLTNYDQTLLAVVLSGLAGETKIERRPCTALPWRKVNVAVLKPAVRAFLATGNTGLAGAKLQDDVDDEGRLRSRLLAWVLRGPVDAAHERLRALGFPVSRLVELPARQRAIEGNPAATLDALSAPSSELLGQIFAHGALLAERPDATQPMLAMGAALAKAIYLCDALEDLEEDRRRGRFNAVLATVQATDSSVDEQPAIEQATQLIDHSLATASSHITTLLHKPQAEIASAVLRRLGTRAHRYAAAAKSRGRTRTERLAEAGDCDLPCDACCDGGGCGGGSGSGCCECCHCTCDRTICSKRSRNRLDKPSNAKQPSTNRSNDDGQARTTNRLLEDLIGQSGVAVSELGLTGRIAIDGVEYDARCRDYATPGRYVRVEAVDAENHLLLVTRDRLQTP